MRFGAISTNPLRQRLIDISKHEMYRHRLRQRYTAYLPYDSHFISDTYDLSTVRIDACNKFEALILLFDYLNLNANIFEDGRDWYRQLSNNLICDWNEELWTPDEYEDMVFNTNFLPQAENSNKNRCSCCRNL